MNARTLVVTAVFLSASITAYGRTVDQAPAAGQAEALQSVTVVGKAGYKLAPHEFMDYEYAYVLDSGERIIFSRRVNRYYGQLTGKNTKGPIVELSPLAAGKFATADGARIEFKEDGDLVVVTNPEVMRTSHIAAR
jgi:hypothetical protein